jgi:hypothetical protein
MATNTTIGLRSRREGTSRIDDDGDDDDGVTVSGVSFGATCTEKYLSHREIRFF